VARLHTGEADVQTAELVGEALDVYAEAVEIVAWRSRMWTGFSVVL
jgi:hypothetical protein